MPVVTKGTEASVSPRQRLTVGDRQQGGGGDAQSQNLGGRSRPGGSAVWVIGGLLVWAFILAGFMVWDLHSTSRTAIWAIFAGWCIGVLGASIARKIYR
jgi:hypothetical protein